MAKYLLEYGEAVSIGCETAEAALEFADLANGWHEDSPQVKLEDALSRERVLSEKIKTLNTELSKRDEEIKDLKNQVWNSNHKVKDLERKVKKLDADLANALRGLPAIGAGGKWGPYREAIRKYIEQNGPTAASNLAKTCGVPSGSIAAVLQHAWFVRLDDGRWVNATTSSENGKAQANADGKQEESLSDKVVAYLRTNGKSKAGFIAGAVGSDIDAVMEVLKDETRFDRDPRDSSWFVVEEAHA